MHKTEIIKSWKEGLKADCSGDRIKNLVRILEEIPLTICPAIKREMPLGNGSFYIHSYKSLIVKTPYGDGVALSSACDNMTKTLIHEGLHILYPHDEDEDIENKAYIYSNNHEIKKVAQKRIVDYLTEYEFNCI